LGIPAMEATFIPNDFWQAPSVNLYKKVISCSLSST
jgi:hypothetical protein